MSSQWTQGEVRCIHCRHRWRAVRPRGTERLECPNCHMPTPIAVPDKKEPEA